MAVEEKPINERNLLFAPAIFNSACTTVGALESFKEQGIEIDDYIGYGAGGAVLALSASGKSEKEILEALKKTPNIENNMAEYLGNMTFGELKEKTGKNLMIQTTQINPDGTKSALIFSADNFKNLPIAEACRVSTTLNSPLGVITKRPTKTRELQFEGKTYTCCDGNMSAREIPDLIHMKEYKNRIISTMKFPIHPRSKRIANIMEACNIKLAPHVSFFSAVPPKFRSKHNINNLIDSLSVKGSQETKNQIEKNINLKNLVPHTKVPEVIIPQRQHVPSFVRDINRSNRFAGMPQIDKKKG